VACGSEADSVEADYSDTVAADCETVDRDTPPPVVDPPPPVIPPPPTGNGSVVEPPVAAVSNAPAALTSGGVVVVKLACPSDAFEGCDGTVQIDILSGKKGATVKPGKSARLSESRRRKLPARRHFKIAAGKTAKVPVQLDRRAFRKFRRRRHLKAMVTVTMSNATGTTTSTHVVTLRRSFKPPRKKHGRK